MSYQVIARKYRPQKFSDVVGQEHVTRTLSNAIQQKRIAHAYLFVGPRGTGKTTIARIFAKCLNCTGGPKVDFPDDDPRAQEVAEGRSLDVLEIDGASNRGIEEIRELRETVKYAPATSPFKIYIIDEVHMLTKEAFNALLKTLEEPPAHVKFMFATTEPEKVLPTILSRCQRFDLRRIPVGLIVSHLRQIAEKEKIAIDEPALLAIARGSDGGMRDAESTLDQLISFCGEKIEENDVLSVFGLTAQSQIFSLADSILEGKLEKGLTELNDLAQNGKDLGRLLADLLGHFRNLLIYRVAGNSSLLELGESDRAAVESQAGKAELEGLSRIMEILSETDRKLREATSRKIVFEVALLKCMEARNAVPIDKVLARLEEMRGGGGSSGNARPPGGAGFQNQPSPTPTPSRSSAPPAAAAGSGRASSSAAAAAHPPETPAESVGTSAPLRVSSEGGNNLDQLWTQVAEAAGRASAFIRSYLINAHPISFEKNLFLIGYDPEFGDQLGLVDNPKNRQLLQTKLGEFGFPQAQVKFILAEVPAGWKRAELLPEPPLADTTSQEPIPEARQAPALSPAASVQPATASEKSPVAGKGTGSGSKEDFKNDPLIKKALDVFKGQIVDIRT